MSKKVIFVVLAGFLFACSDGDVSFSDERLQGVLGGEVWRAEHIESITYDFGSRKESQASIYTVPCKEYECLAIKAPSINISNLDLSVMSGSLSVNNSVTIFTPPNKNLKVKNGTYRLSSVGNETKLELKFHFDEENQVNGYITYKSL